MTRRCPSTIDIEAWLAQPAPVPTLATALTRRDSFYSRHIGVLKLALEGKSRAVVAEEMSTFLGGDLVTESYLNAAVSEARPTHTLNAVRYGALVATTRDPRLVSVYADLIDHVVVPANLVPFIRVGLALEAKSEADLRLREARRQAGGR